MIDEAEDISDEQQSRDEIYGERAQSLVTFVKSAKPPVKRGTLGHFAMGKNWHPETLQLVLDYCLGQKLLASYTSFSGVTAYKLPLTPVHEEEGEESAATAPTTIEPVPQPRIVKLHKPPTAGAVRAQRHDSEARTAPAVNYGCPEHGAARSGAEENKSMAKHWITTAEAVELLGCSQVKTSALARAGKIESRKAGDSRGAPREFRRSSLIAYLATEKKKSAAGDLLEQSPPPQRRIAARVVRLHRKERTENTPRAKAAPPPPSGDLALADDVRALARNVERGWMSAEDAWSKLRELVA